MAKTMKTGYSVLGVADTVSIIFALLKILFTTKEEKKMKKVAIKERRKKEGFTEKTCWFIKNFSILIYFLLALLLIAWLLSNQGVM